ncbi:MAG: RHS repeat-associated core domain-containing protein, partial [Paludibacteraceae bacterium]|nr:RHS repeat-associated core domain-containing protein [Paludibacteraceae bacterium]
MTIKNCEYTYFYIHDHLGSTSMVLDVDGNISQSVTYIPYGEIFVEERNGSWNSPYLFNSKELDEETGLYYYGARYLNPTNGMWLSVDPLWERHIDKNPYAYCLNNPIRFSDPTGMWEWDENGNLVAQKNDNAWNLAKFLDTKLNNALSILKDNGVTVNDKGILNLKENQKLYKSTLWVESKDISGVVV